MLVSNQKHSEIVNSLNNNEKKTSESSIYLDLLKNNFELENPLKFSKPGILRALDKLEKQMLEQISSLNVMYDEVNYSSRLNLSYLMIEKLN
jgi:hypothetical protein